MSHPIPVALPSVGAGPIAAEDYRALVEGLVDHCVAFLDVEGRVLTWNTGARRIHGYAPEEIVGAPLASRRSPPACW